MSRHYMFHNNTVTAHDSWVIVLSLPEGVFFYSPHDSFDAKWGRLTGQNCGVWEPVIKQDMPKEFLIQLLLMGVPC